MQGLSEKKLLQPFSLWDWACSFPFFLSEIESHISGQSKWEVHASPTFSYGTRLKKKNT